MRPPDGAAAEQLPDDGPAEKGEGKGGLGAAPVATDEQADSSLLNEAINQGLTSLSAPSLADTVINKTKLAKKIIGPTLLRELTGYDPETLERNMRYPEFEREVRDRIEEKVERLREKGALDEQ